MKTILVILLSSLLFSSAIANTSKISKKDDHSVINNSTRNSLSLLLETSLVESEGINVWHGRELQRNRNKRKRQRQRKRRRKNQRRRRRQGNSQNPRKKTQNKRNKNNNNRNKRKNNNNRNKTKKNNKKNTNKNNTNKNNNNTSRLFNWRNHNKQAARRSGGFFDRTNDVCLKRSDGKCPCYPEDDDGYCTGKWYPWRFKVENPANDALYEKCNASRFPKCGAGQKLCPMRKPRLDRFINRNDQDMYYYIDYDCIQCVPIDENCSMCSPGLYCHGLGRCVGPRLVGWCKRTFPEYYPNRQNKW